MLGKPFAVTRACLTLLVALASAAGPLHAQEVAPGLVVRQLTKDGKSYTERGMGCAPAGDRIVFYKDVSKTDRQLWVMKSDGTGEQAISPVGWPFDCGWAPDGTTLAYVFATKNEGTSEAVICIYNCLTRRN